MIKYRLGFTMSAETLFALMAKVLPIEDLSVEEIAPTPVREKRITHDPAIRFDKRFDAPKPKLKRKFGARAPGYKPNLEAGTNAIILKVLADGQIHRTREIKDGFLAAGYNPNGTGSSIERQRKWGLIEKAGIGQWRLTKQHMQKQSA